MFIERRPVPGLCSHYSSSTSSFRGNPIAFPEHGYLPGTHPSFQSISSWPPSHLIPMISRGNAADDQGSRRHAPKAFLAITFFLSCVLFSKMPSFISFCPVDFQVAIVVPIDSIRQPPPRLCTDGLIRSASSWPGCGFPATIVGAGPSAVHTGWLQSLESCLNR